MSRKQKSIFADLDLNLKVLAFVLFFMLFSLPVGLIGVMTGVLDFSQAASGPNVLKNKSFEDGEANGLPLFWTGQGLKKADGVSDKISSSGDYSFRFVGSNKPKVLRQTINDVNWKAGDSIFFTSMVKYNESDADGVVGVQIDTVGAGPPLETIMIEDINSHVNGWGVLTLSRTLNYDTKHIVVSLYVRDQKGEVFFDRLHLNKVFLPSPKPTATATPPPNPTPTPIACKTGVNSFAVREPCGDGYYRYASFECHDGYSGLVGGETSCKPSSLWSEYVQDICFYRSSCDTPNSTPTPTPWQTPPPPSPSPTYTPVPYSTISPTPGIAP